MPSAPVGAPVALVDDLDAAVEAYLTAVRGDQPSPGSMAVLLDDDKVDAVNRFAVKLAQAMDRPETAFFMATAPLAAHSAALQNLPEAVADFVRPGDLSRTGSLNTIGNLH